MKNISFNTILRYIRSMYAESCVNCRIIKRKYASGMCNNINVHLGVLVGMAFNITQILNH